MTAAVGQKQPPTFASATAELASTPDAKARKPVTAPKKSENADIQLSALGEKIMKVTTLILALLALALGTGTAIVVSVQTQPVVACGSPNC
jgi:uncharacterized protein HemX